nr:variable surface lipoprotein [Mycoplasmopsis bovis]
MKKSKFLLLGSVASLASIPFVAAKCGETKEEKKPEEADNRPKPAKAKISGKIGKSTSANRDKSNKKKWSR